MYYPRRVALTRCQAFPRFREFIIFHGEYIYPEYVIAYQRFHGQTGGPVG